MPVELKESHGGTVLEVIVSGKLTAEDYQRFVPEFERLAEMHDRLSVLFDMRDFHGWELRALWEDLKFDTKHFADIDRLAMVGDRKWEEGMAAFCRPFTKATVRYFDQTERDQARAWVAEPRQGG